MGWIFDPRRALDDDEARRVLHAARQMADAGRGSGRFRDARDGHLICFLFDSGCRITEALRTTVGDVISQRGAVYVMICNLKRKDPAKTPVEFVGMAADRVRDWVAWLRSKGAPDGAPLFPSTTQMRKAVSRQAAWSTMKRVLRGVGIDRAGVGVHAARHAVAIITLRATRNMRAVQGRLRHASVMTTERYAVMLPADFHQAVTAAQDALDGDGSG